MAPGGLSVFPSAAHEMLLCRELSRKVLPGGVILCSLAARTSGATASALGRSLITAPLVFAPGPALVIGLRDGGGTLGIVDVVVGPWIGTLLSAVPASALRGGPQGETLPRWILGLRGLAPAVVARPGIGRGLPRFRGPFLLPGGGAPLLVVRHMGSQAKARVSHCTPAPPKMRG